MATKCDDKCTDCLDPGNGARTFQRHICLRSEERFLGSLLSKQGEDGGRENLLGFEPTDLVDWYLYARRNFGNGRGKDDFARGLKLLDELAKVLFDVNQVTASEPEGGQPLLLSKAEIPLARAYIHAVQGGSSEYEEYVRLCGVAKERLEKSPDAKGDYIETYEIRQGMLGLWRPTDESEKEALRLTWMGRPVWLLYWRNEGLQREDLSRRRLAKAYLEGVSRFAFRSSGPVDEASPGYWIDDQTPIGQQTPEAEAAEHELRQETSSGAKPLPQEYGGIPTLDKPELQLACGAAASFLDDYLSAATRRVPDSLAFFDIIFMCKGENGWFWAFTKDQLRHLEEEWRGARAGQEGSFHRVLESFRFRTAGFINLLERTENLVVELRDFREEKFICVKAGYTLEADRGEAKAFEDIEAGIPRLDDSAFFYFRVSSPKPGNQGPADERERGESLPIGALVAVARIPRSLHGIKRIERMRPIRECVDRWRAKDEALPRIRSVVQAIERPHQRRTARAAIMSRNMSHNVGSHSLANSRFHDAVGVLHLQSLPPNENSADEQCLYRTPPKNRKTNRDETYITKGEVWRARTRLSSLNAYLQGRMDFIARALGESASHPEPMFFVNDLLRGFLSQTVLLNTLLSDNGFAADKMEFRLFLPRSTGPIVFEKADAEDHELRHAEFAPRKGSSTDDVLVAVPGGMTGRHAFYAFLENLLRNAAKYGNRSRDVARSPVEKFVVTMRLESRDADEGLPGLDAQEERTACYQLTITDNLSTDGEARPSDGSVARMGESATGTKWSISRRIRRHLAEDIIDDEGRARTEGHGIQEMKVCAQFLAGGDQRALRFHGDSDCRRVGCKADREYLRYLESIETAQSALPHGTTREGEQRTDETVSGSVRCFGMGPNSGEAQPEGGADPYLAYQLILLRPTILGITSWPPKGAGVRTEATDSSVVFYESVAAMASAPAYFGIVAASGGPDAVLIKSISAWHHALPYRLMIAVRTEQDAASWRASIAKWQEEAAAGWWKRRENAGSSGHAFPLPPRRLHVIQCAALFEPEPGGVAEAWKDVILSVYESWLRSFKGEELEAAFDKRPESRAWHLFIGFDRDAETVRANWRAIDGRDFSSELIRLHLCAKRGGDNGTSVLVSLDESAEPGVAASAGLPGSADPDVPGKACLVLDNHGRVLPSVKHNEDRAAYHAFSGSGQPALFQILERPPQDSFARSFLVFAVVEALLTRVFVVDERVAEATIDLNDDGAERLFRKTLERLQRAGIFPLYSIQTEKVTEGETVRDSYALSVRIGKAMIPAADASGRTLSTEEGLAVSPVRRDSSILGARPALVERPGTPRIVDPAGFMPDCLIVHEGVVDQVHSKGGWPGGLHRQLHAFCPWVVRTSGRGAGARHLGHELPFLEFSELSDTVYRQLNKLSLVQSLFSLRGGPLDGE